MNLTGDTAASIKIRTTEEIMAARAAQLALFIVEFMAAARAPAPVFSLDHARIASSFAGPNSPFIFAIPSNL